MSGKFVAGIGDCWNEIGVHGDHSCPELKKHIHCRNCPVFASMGRELLEQEPPMGYTYEWTELLAKEKAVEAKLDRSVVIFRIGAEWLALETNLFVEIAEPKPLHRVAHRTNKFLVGVVNIRGQLQLCMSVRKLLQIEGEPSPRTARLCVIERDKEPWVFDTDEVFGVHHFGEADIGAVPATLDAKPDGKMAEAVSTYTRAVIRWGAKRVGLLDEERLIAAFGRSLE
jgi:chemotaxis-related protein WspD